LLSFFLDVHVLFFKKNVFELPLLRNAQKRRAMKENSRGVLKIPAPTSFSGYLPGIRRFQKQILQRPLSKCAMAMGLYALCLMSCICPADGRRGIGGTPVYAVFGCFGFRLFWLPLFIGFWFFGFWALWF
jgi:hypothetical protein